MVSVQVLYAKQGLRVKRQLTRANVKEKVKETRRVLTKLRFMAKEVQLLPEYHASEQERVLGWLPGLLPELGLFLCCLSLLCKIPGSSCWKLPYFMEWLL